MRVREAYRSGVIKEGDELKLRITIMSWYTKRGLNGPVRPGDWRSVKYAMSSIKEEAADQSECVARRSEVKLQVNRVPGEEDHVVGYYRATGMVDNGPGQPKSMMLSWVGGKEGPKVPKYANVAMRGEYNHRM